MENSTLDNDFNTDSTLRIDDEIRNYMRETSKWAKFLSIVGFVMAGLMVLGALFMGTILSSFGEAMGDDFGSFPFAFMSFFYIAFAALYVIPNLYLFKFATKTKKALDGEDQYELARAFENLKSLFKFVGIFTAIILGFYAFMILITLLFGAMAM